jgi:hypothetical protein
MLGLTWIFLSRAAAELPKNFTKSLTPHGDEIFVEVEGSRQALVTPPRIPLLPCLPNPWLLQIGPLVIKINKDIMPHFSSPEIVTTGPEKNGHL